jgi:DNA recombination-dependent growth factor C
LNYQRQFSKKKKRELFQEITLSFLPPFFSKKKKEMISIRAPTAHRDVTYNNIKASKSSINDVYAQTITKIDGANHVEVFETLSRLHGENGTLREQVQTLVGRLAELERRVTDLTVEE